MARLEKIATLKVADAVWVATAMLQREHPEKEGFSVADIVERVKAEGLTEGEEGSIYLHANQHCVANRPPNQARLRMLFQTQGNLRRLFCPTESFHPARNGRFCPEPSELPYELLYLIDWYEGWCVSRRAEQHRLATRHDPLLALAGTGDGRWGLDAVAYVNKLRAE
jgi:hypothetical protein